MASKKTKKEMPVNRKANPNAVIENAGVMVEQQITDTLEKNYMPYAMSVIVSRAIPEIDGFKPSHRKLLYTMYKMGLLTGARTKSANVVGQTMRLNPHGDMAIYETMVRMSRGCEALLHPYVDSKGNFGKAYSRDMAFAASRYTEVKLDSICAELFGDIDKNTVDFVDNYDNTMKEPSLLPVSFPAIIVNSNVGIAVGMASAICPFNLAEVCETTIALLKNPQHDLIDTLKAPDFPGGGYIVYREQELRKIYETGRGGFRVRSRYTYDSANNCIDVTQIPPTTTVEQIMDKIVDLVKAGKIRDISDMRDETDLNGLKLTLDLKRGVDPDKLMLRLFKSTPLEDTYSCNFNVLIDGMPRVCGVRELITEWAKFREGCVGRRVSFDLRKKQEKLHLLLGLGQILLDIDKAIRIVRETQEESEVVPNLMIGFGIDETQAEYIAEIKLRQLNRENIIKRMEETDQLKKDIEQMQAILADKKKIRALIIAELKEIGKKYAQPRKSLLYYPAPDDDNIEPELAPDYPVNLFVTREGYFKKITPQSLRMSGEHKLKEGDGISQSYEATNNSELLFFTNKGQVYKAHASDFDDGKTSQMGDYLPAKLGMDEGESVLYLALSGDYSGYMAFFFANGKAAKVDMSAYATKTNRKKLIGAYYTGSPLVSIHRIIEDVDLLLLTSNNRAMIFNTGMLSPKATRSTQGVTVMQLRKNAVLERVSTSEEYGLVNENRFRSKSIPSAGATLRGIDTGEQLSFGDAQEDEQQ